MSLSQTSMPAQTANFFRHGRLVNIPRKAVRRDQLLRYLAETLFEADCDYTEADVTRVLLTVHEDHAALRRHLVDAGMLARTRDGAHYRRTE